MYERTSGSLFARLGVGSTADHVYKIVFPAVWPKCFAILKVNFTMSFSLQKTVQNRV